MRNFLLIFSLFAVLNIDAQEYKPLFKEGRVWNYVVSSGGTPEAYITVTVCDATADGDKTRWKLHNMVKYREYDGDTGEWTDKCNDYYSTGYEEGGKVYYGSDDHLLIDFSKHKGEQTGPYTVYAEDSIEVRGERYRRMRLFDEAGYDKYYNYYYVEGIGASCCLAMNLEDSEHAKSEVTYLESCYDNGELVFTFDDFATAATTGIGAVRWKRGKDGQRYDLSGRKLGNAPGRGVFIKDGKKYIGR